MSEMAKENSKLFFLLVFIGLFLFSSFESIIRVNANEVDSGTKVMLNLENAVIVNEIDRKFLSFTIDAHQLAKRWTQVNLTSKRLRDLTRRLQPANVRLGGTDSDKIEFCPDENHNNCDKEIGNSQDHFLVTGKDFLLLADFVKETKLDLIYGLNVLQRQTTQLKDLTLKSRWNSTNTKSLLEFLSKNQVKVFGWELGNEPDSFLHVFNVSVKSPDLAQDFSSLKKLLKNFKLYENSLIIGPDVTRPTGKKSRSLRYLKGFLHHVDSNILDVVTFHQYYFEGRSATPQDFLNVTIMDLLKTEINRVKRSVRKYQKGKLIWIGETSSGWGGGCHNISDRFASSFLWLDKLGQAAQFGVNMVFRQTLIHGFYGLLNSEEEPTPDYFISLLHKRLVGGRTFGFYHLLTFSSGHNSKLESLEKEDENIFNSSSSKYSPRGLRLYVHCTKTKKYKGSLTVFGINVENEDYEILIKGIPPKPKNLIKEFIIQAPSLTSKYAYLNGRILKLKEDDSLPSLKPIVVLRNNNRFHLPKESIGFWVFPSAQHQLCL